jgi:hypothetical protein
MIYDLKFGQTFSGNRQLSRDLAKRDTVLCCRHTTTGWLEERGRRKDQLMIAVQGSL